MQQYLDVIDSDEEATSVSSEEEQEEDVMKTMNRLNHQQCPILESPGSLLYASSTNKFPRMPYNNRSSQHPQPGPGTPLNSPPLLSLTSISSATHATHVRSHRSLVKSNGKLKSEKKSFTAQYKRAAGSTYLNDVVPHKREHSEYLGAFSEYQRANNDSVLSFTLSSIA